MIDLSLNLIIIFMADFESKTFFESPQKQSRKKKVGIELPKLTNSNFKETRNIENPFNNLLLSNKPSFKKSQTNKTNPRAALDRCFSDTNQTINDVRAKYTNNIEQRSSVHNTDYYKNSPVIDSQKGKFARNSESILNDSFYKDMLEKYQTLNKNKKKSCPQRYDADYQQTSENLYGVVNHSQTSKNFKMNKSINYLNNETNNPTNPENLIVHQNNFSNSKIDDKGFKLRNDKKISFERPCTEVSSPSVINTDKLSRIEAKQDESIPNTESHFDKEKKSLKLLKLLEKKPIENDNENRESRLMNPNNEKDDILQKLMGSSDNVVPQREMMKTQKKSMGNILSKIKNRKKKSDIEMPVVLKDNANENLNFVEQLYNESREPDIKNNLADEQEEVPIINFSNSIKSVSRTESKPKRAKLFCCI